MRLVSMIAALVAVALFSAGTARAADPDNTLYIDLKDGRVVIEMYPKLAPKHVAQIKALALAHKYDGVVFHRVIAGFMAQTGDPTGTGSGGMGDTLPAEFNDQPHTQDRGWNSSVIRPAGDGSAGTGPTPRTPYHDPAARYFATSIHIGEPQANSSSACVTRT